jgi:hypothetical protein
MNHVCASLQTCEGEGARRCVLVSLSLGVLGEPEPAPPPF